MSTQPFQVAKVLINKHGLALAKAYDLTNNYREVIKECSETTDMDAEEMAEMIVIDEELETVNALAEESVEELSVPLEDELHEIPQQEDTEKADDFGESESLIDEGEEEIEGFEDDDEED